MDNSSFPKLFCNPKKKKDNSCFEQKKKFPHSTMGERICMYVHARKESKHKKLAHPPLKNQN